MKNAFIKVVYFTKIPIFVTTFLIYLQSMFYLSQSVNEYLSAWKRHFYSASA